MLPSEYIYKSNTILLEANKIGRITTWVVGNVNPGARVNVPIAGLSVKECLENAINFIDGVWSY